MQLYLDGTFKKKNLSDFVLSDFDKGQTVRTKKTKPEHPCVGSNGECTYSVVPYRLGKKTY